MALVALFTFVCAVPAFAGPIIFGINDDSDRFHSYNLSNGNRTDFGATMPNEIESLTWGGGNTYYGMQSFNTAGTKSTLYKFTIGGNESGGFTVSSKAGLSIEYDNIDSMEYANGSLYAIDNSLNKMLQLDLDGKVVGSWDSGLNKVEGMAYDGQGNLYLSQTYKGAKKDTSDLYVMNLSTKLVTKLGTLDYGQVEALTFVDGILYGTSDTNDELFSVDFAGGSVSTNYVGDWGTDIEGMAPAVPIPAAVWLLGSGLIGLVGIRRKLKKM